jgi:GGDEF domain-containing protein
VDRLMAWQATAAAFLEWLGGLGAALGIPWSALHAGFAGLVFISLAGGVVAFTRRRQDLFHGLSIGWGFALLLGATGGLMLAAPLTPDPGLAYVRGAQVITAPLALLLMLAFLLRLRGLEEYEDSEARQATLHTELTQTRQRLAHLQAENAELARQREAAEDESRRLAAERNEATRQASELRIRDEGSGLYTREHFVERLREEFERAHRRGTLPLPLFIGLQGLEALSVDSREEVLDRAGRIVREDLRLPDLACRFADSEMLVIPCETDAKGAGLLARRLHRRLKRGLPRTQGSEGLSVTCVFVLLDFDVGLQRFEDFLEACERSIEPVRRQPPDRLTRLPARLADEA